MSSQNDETVEVNRNTEQNRYELYVDAKLAGHADYTVNDGLVTFTHTEVDPSFGGRGLASRLVHHALDDVRDAGDRKVLPVCPYVKRWIRRHEDYLDLLSDPAQ